MPFRRSHRPARAVLVGLIAATMLGVTGLSAIVSPSIAEAAAPAKPHGTTTVTTPTGRSLTVTPVKALSGKGQRIKVTGSGFDMTTGIYVALCVKPKKGRVPTPCGGGINTSGKDAESVWVSSNPPAYGQNLAVPFKPGGTFSVTLKVSAMIGKKDCRKVACAVVTRADHTHSDDRSADVVVPVTFAP